MPNKSRQTIGGCGDFSQLQCFVPVGPHSKYISDGSPDNGEDKLVWSSVGSSGVETLQAFSRTLEVS